MHRSFGFHKSPKTRKKNALFFCVLLKNAKEQCVQKVKESGAQPWQKSRKATKKKKFNLVKVPDSAFPTLSHWAVERPEYSISSPRELIFSLNIWLFYSMTLCYQVYVIRPPSGDINSGAWYRIRALHSRMGGVNEIRSHSRVTDLRAPLGKYSSSTNRAQYSLTPSSESGSVK